MHAADARRWIFTEIAFGGEPVESGGSTFTLEPVSQVLVNVEHHACVWERRRVELSDHVPVETLPSGEQRNHWGHILRDEAEVAEVSAP